MRPRPFTVLYVLAALAGLAFSGVSTFDFVQHLDREVHTIHCGFFPGAPLDAAGTSGCQTTLMSPYSSVFRSEVWGGLPISLPGMAVFAFLVFRGLDLVLNRREDAVASNLPFENHDCGDGSGHAYVLSVINVALRRDPAGEARCRSCACARRSA